MPHVRYVFALCMVLLAAVPLSATDVMMLPSIVPSEIAYPTPGTWNVFPDIATGYFNDGSSYRSTLFVANPGTETAYCRHWTLYVGYPDVPPGIFFTVPPGGSLTRQLPSSATAATFENPDQPVRETFKYGHAITGCSQPIQAYITYEFLDAQGSVLHITNVPAARPSQAAQYVFPPQGGYGLAVAVANGQGLASPIEIRIRVATAEGPEFNGTATVPGQGRVVFFADSAVNLPPGYTPTALMIEATSGGPFYTLGFLFNGPAFSAVEPIVLF